MKILKLSFLLFSLCFFAACIDTEELIDLNADGSGQYSLSMDMGKLIEMASSMGGDKGTPKKTKEKIDTLIYFKDAVAASDKLSADEKAIFKDGQCKIKFDEANSEMKIVLSCPFKDMNTLAVVKKDLPGLLDKLGLMDKATGKGKKKSELSEMGGDGDLANAVNPSDKYYNFSAVPGKISYSIPDKESFKKLVANDSIMQMMQQSALMMGDMTSTTIIKLPSPVKSVSNPKAVLSADKKTVTIKTIVTNMMEKPEEAEYSIEY